jgi:hypothetical protein
VVGGVRTRGSAAKTLLRDWYVHVCVGVGGLPLISGLTQDGEFILNRSLIFG